MLHLQLAYCSTHHALSISNTQGNRKKLVINALEYTVITSVFFVHKTCRKLSIINYIFIADVPQLKFNTSSNLHNVCYNVFCADKNKHFERKFYSKKYEQSF